MNPCRRRAAGMFTVLTATLVLAGCPDPDGAVDGADAVQRFDAELQPIGPSGVTGTTSIELDMQSFRVALDASGLEPGARISQHLNSWWDCTTIGRILVNLDTLLTVPGEGPPRGDDYPRVDAEGRVSYAATRSVSELAEVLHQYRGMLVDELDIGNRTIFMRDDAHRPIACGELEPAQ